jgi:hypothetical protein
VIKKLALSALVPAVVLGTMAVLPGSAAAADAASKSRASSYLYYDIVAVHSGKCLDVFGVSTGDGADVIQWGCWGGQNQQWRLDGRPGNYLVRAAHSGKCLDVAGGSTANGADVIQWACHGGNNQRWRLDYVGGGKHRLVAVHSGKCLDVSGASGADGADVIQWTCHGGTNQQWRLR